MPRYFSNSADKPCVSEGSTPETWCNFTTRTFYQSSKSLSENVEIITNWKTLYFLPKGQNVYTKKPIAEVPRYKGVVIP